MSESEKRIGGPFISQARLTEYSTAQSTAALHAEMRRAAEYAANVGLVVHYFDTHTLDETSAAAAKYKGPLKSDRFVTTYLCDNEVERLQLEAHWISMAIRPVTAEEKRDKAEAEKQIRLEIQQWQALRERVVAGEELRLLRPSSEDGRDQAEGRVMSKTLENWLDDHPGKTAADFAEVSARSAAHGPLTWSEAHDFVTCGNRAGLDIVHFETWEVVQELVADGYLVRLGGGNYQYQWTEKRPPGGGRHDCVGIKREVLIRPTDLTPEQLDELRLAQLRAAAVDEPVDDLSPRTVRQAPPRLSPGCA